MAYKTDIFRWVMGWLTAGPEAAQTPPDEVTVFFRVSNQQPHYRVPNQIPHFRKPRS